MRESFEIAGTILQVDKQATKKFYLTEIAITDNCCNCTDCLFYANTFIKQPFELFQKLLEMGVDLAKNLSSEPTGVWCITDPAGQLSHVEQVYQVLGKYSLKLKKK